jgi:ribA/ribD-fused uncharacterized protein
MSKSENSKFVLFWHAPSPFSQWTLCKFQVNNVTYNCMEQYMMAQKARLFQDHGIYKKIMNSNDPKYIKNLGRQVKNFDAKIWDKHKYSIVFNGNLSKFLQNPIMKKALLDTGTAMIGEASPYDRVWGIGLSAQEASKKDPSEWPGQNLLGRILVDVREKIVNSCH